MLQEAVLSLLLFAACSRAETPPVGSDRTVAPAVPATPGASKYAASQILVTWAGAVRAPSGVTRSEEEARDLAESLHVRALGGTPFADLARELSESAEAPRGGRVGAFLPGTMVPEFEAAVAALPIGGISAPFRSPFGWHVVRRDPVEEAHLAHVLVPWAGAWRSTATRSKDEARARAEAALARITAGDDFAAVALAFSEDPTAKVGGDLGTVTWGQLVPPVEEAGFALRPGQTSGIVESAYGFHVLHRVSDQ